jgi:hypothetical protein
LSGIKRMPAGGVSSGAGLGRCSFERGHVHYFRSFGSAILAPSQIPSCHNSTPSDTGIPTTRRHEMAIRTPEETGSDEKVAKINALMR